MMSENELIRTFPCSVCGTTVVATKQICGGYMLQCGCGVISTPANLSESSWYRKKNVVGSDKLYAKWWNTEIDDRERVEGMSLFFVLLAIGIHYFNPSSSHQIIYSQCRYPFKVSDMEYRSETQTIWVKFQAVVE